MKTNVAKTVLTMFLAMILVLPMVFAFAACDKRETVVIYTSSEDYKIADMQERLDKQFPNYKIIINYVSTGDHAAQLVANGENAPCDITHDLEYPYLAQLDALGYLADLSSFDKSIYADDVNLSQNYIIELRLGGGIIINTEKLAAEGLEEPKSYQDLLKPCYKGLISMPSPKASGTGFMFLKSLVNAWGQTEALAYFDALTENILAYTSSGSGPVKALVAKEAVIGLGMISQAVVEINKGAPLVVKFFEEGAPYTMYGQAIIKGKDSRKCVQEVFAWLINEYNEINNKTFFPEQIFKDKDYLNTVKNYPTTIPYCDMSGNTIEAKTSLLALWNH